MNNKLPVYYSDFKIERKEGVIRKETGVLKEGEKNKEFVVYKCTLLVIRAVRFNLFTLDSNERKWDQLRPSLLRQQ